MDQNKALNSEYIIDGVHMETCPADLLNECMSGVRNLRKQPSGDVGEILDESLDKPVKEGSFAKDSIERYASSVERFCGQRPFELAFAEQFTRQRIARALLNAIWTDGHFTLGDLSIRMLWQWNSKTVGAMAAFYSSATAAADYIYDLNGNIASYGFEDGHDVCALKLSVEGCGERRLCPEKIAGEDSDWLIYIPFDTCGYRLGASLLARAEGPNGDAAPEVNDPDWFIDCYEVVRELIEDKIVTAGTTVCDGGIIAAVKRCCSSASLNISGISQSYGEKDTVRILFSEVPGVLIRIRDVDYDYLDAQMVLQDIAYYPLGHCGSGDGDISITDHSKPAISSLLDALLDKASEGGRLTTLETMAKKPKIFVLDTNVILHDYKAIRKFQDNDIVIPMAVIEELDKFKKGNDALAFNARGFVRDLDRLTGNKLFGKYGVPIGKNMGCIKVELNHPFPQALQACFKDDIQDHRIIATAMWVRDNNPDRFVALVTKDINMRMKAKAVGMEVQDYMTDRVEEARVEGALKEVQVINGISADVLQSLAYGPDTAVDWKDIFQKEPVANQLYKFNWPGSDTVSCARYDAARKKVVLVKSREAYGIRPRNDEQKFAIDACTNPKIQLVSLTGGAGTGKTLIALAAALEQENDFDQIILTRPAVILGNQDLGFLPGDQKSKMSPFIQPLMDNLNVIKSVFKPTSKQALRIESMLKDEKLLISPLAYIRGRSLGKVFFIIDEAQNLTPHEVKTIITRAGEGTKVVFTGDIHQIDQPYLDQWSNGLTHLSDKMNGLPLFQHVNLRKGERSELSEMAAKLL